MTAPAWQQEFFRRHIESVLTGDPDEVVSAYRPDAVVMRPDGLTRGRSAIRKLYASMYERAGVPPRPTWDATADGDVIFAVWKIDRAGHRQTGCETMMLREGSIAVHTLFTAPPAE